MVYFVSNGQHNINPISIKQYTSKDTAAIEEIVSRIFLSEGVGFDYETNGRDAYENFPLLLSIGDHLNQIVFDLTSVNPFEFFTVDQAKVWIGQNLAFDLKFLAIHYNLTLPVIWDTMIAEQKLRQNLGQSADQPQGLRFDLRSITERRLNYVPSSMDKSIRTAFVGRTKHTVFSHNEIEYSASDVAVLPDIYYKQKAEAEKRNLLWYLTEIGNPLIKSVVKCELRGIDIDDTKWLANTKRNERLKFDTAILLDEELLSLRDLKLSGTDAYYLLVGGKYTNKRNDYGEVLQGSLFGDPTELSVGEKKELNSYNVNWSSSEQVIDVCARLGLMLPTDNPDVPFAVPRMKFINNKAGSATYTIDKSRHSFTTNAKQLAQMIAENPHFDGKKFIELLIKYREYDHAISSFGYAFLNKRNKITGRIHTSYRTERAQTGRFQSGGGKDDPSKVNFQNIPSDEEYRSCFIAPHGYSMVTCDLSGAEVTIMCDKAHDMKLYEWAVINDDAHSPIAQSCWRAVYLFRAGFEACMWNNAKEFMFNKNNNTILKLIKEAGDKNPSIADNFEKAQNFVISKNENKQLRTDFKPITFGSVYGMFAAKCAATLGIPKEEGEVILLTLKETIPDTFEYVENNVKFALNNGYLRLDDRTNSVVWFQSIIRHLRDDEPLAFKDKSLVDGAARNYPIQGTQASMIKEAIVEINKAIEKYKLDCHLVNTVHDELVYIQPLYLDGQSTEWDANFYLHTAKAVPFFFDDNTPIEYKEKLLNSIKGNHVKKVFTDGKTKIDRANVSFPAFVYLTMIQVSNRYLKHFKMGAAFDVAPYWKK